LRKIEFSTPESGQSRKVFWVAAVAWLPLLILTAIDRTAWGTRVQIPFLYDLVSYARFLVALPIGLAAASFINPRGMDLLGALLKRELIAGRDVPRFLRMVKQAGRLRGSRWAMGLLVILVYVYVHLGFQREHAPGVSSWCHVGEGKAWPWTAADWWFVYVSMPLFLFVWFRWLWSLSIWGWLLFRISRLKLRIVATHPDGIGGLNFINVAHRRLAILVFAVSAILSASIGENILVAGARLKTYESELVLFFMICLLVSLGPLIVFTPALVRTKLGYWKEYGILAGTYVRRFDKKWIDPPGPPGQDLLGTSDIQSLADLKNSYSLISEMRTVLPSRKTVGVFALAYVAPALPLVLTVIPLNQVLVEVYKLLLK
jgi:hypothetical protein